MPRLGIYEAAEEEIRDKLAGLRSEPLPEAKRLQAMGGRDEGGIRFARAGRKGTSFFLAGWGRFV